MKFTFAVKQLRDAMRQTSQKIEQCRKLYNSEDIDHSELLQMLNDADSSLKSLANTISSTVAANERKFDIIEYLADALTMEHDTIDLLQYCTAVLPAGELRDTLNAMLKEEAEHQHALAETIRGIGGEPHIDHEVVKPAPDMNVLDLLKKHRIDEQKIHDHYETGLNRFEEPEFQWILGQLNLGEKKHLEELDRLIAEITEKYPTIDLLPDELKNAKWIDPTMGKPGDRPWIE